MNFSDPDEMTLLAGEYALGALPPEDRDAFEHELQKNRALAAAVASWHDRLLEVSPAQAPVAPAADLWKRIERDLPRKALTREPSSLWDSLFFWRASGMAGAIASVLLAVMLITASPEPGAPQYLALLQANDQGASWLVQVDAQAVHLRPLAPVAAIPGKSIQFWTKPEGAAGPTSLGLVPSDRPTTVPLDRLPGMSPNQLFEVTLEPATGSPLDRPTGPILAVGKAVRL